MLFDIHVHSTISPCGRMTLEQILEHSGAKGLDGVCITDHDTMAAQDMISQGPQKDGLIVVVGMEYSTPQGDYLLFGPVRDIPRGLDAERMLPMARRAGGVAISAHPFRKARPADTAMLRPDMVHAMEIVNGRNQPDENDRARDFQLSAGVPALSGSDAHTLEELGVCPTRFLAPIMNADDLVRAFKSGAFAPAPGHALPLWTTPSSPGREIDSLP